LVNFNIPERNFPPAKRMNAPSYFCQRCGTQLRWVPEYGRWWCDGCRTYLEGQTAEQQFSNAVTDFGRAVDNAVFGTPHYACPRCGRYARWIPEYQRWYCDGCMSYL
jgi:DNA-directed RNA polymerase subunit RPC12/RpoP